VRTVGDYEKYSGVLFEKRSVQQYTIDKNYPPNPYDYKNEEEWKESFLRIFKHCIDVPLDKIPEDDYDFLVVAFHNDKDETIYRMDAQEEEIKRMGPFIQALKGNRTFTSYWYNDNIINERLLHMKKRDIYQCSLYRSKKPTIFLLSFFMERLLYLDKRYNYSNVKQWTRRKPRIMSCEKVCTIIFFEGHRTIIVVKVEEKRIEYYDHQSQSSDNGIACLAAIKRWVADDALDKCKTILDMTEWECEDVYYKIPVGARQTDIHSCSPYAVVCLELILANLLWEQESWYTQLDMQVHYRNRVMVDIFKGRIDY
jgi:hypothetical protein